MTLQEIREAYLENLKAYNALFPIYSDGRRSPEGFGQEEFDTGFFSKDFRKIFKKSFPKLKEAADQSGNCQVWHRGDPLDDLSQGMKTKIQKALEDEIPF